MSEIDKRSGLANYFSKLSEASSPWCNKCDNLKKFVQMGFDLVEDVYTLNRIIGELDHHISVEHPIRWTRYITLA